MRSLLWIIGVLGLGLLIALTFAVWRADRSFGIATWWERLAGPADLGAVDFATIQRSQTGNDALICPTGMCGSAATDGTAPIFRVPVTQLRDAVRVIEVNDADVFALARDEAKVQDRYLARTAWLRFPDTISVRFVDLGGNRSTLALYSRSQIGASDFGVNKARLDDWINQLRSKLPVATR